MTMKKYIILIFCLFFISGVFAQKNSIELGMTTFNHFDGLGFKTSDNLKLYSSPIVRELATSIFLGIERRINDKTWAIL
jgi:hypothetical protein